MWRHTHAHASCQTLLDGALFFLYLTTALFFIDVLSAEPLFSVLQSLPSSFAPSLTPRSDNLIKGPSARGLPVLFHHAFVLSGEKYSFAGFLFLAYNCLSRPIVSPPPFIHPPELHHSVPIFVPYTQYFLLTFPNLFSAIMPWMKGHSAIKSLITGQCVQLATQLSVIQSGRCHVECNQWKLTITASVCRLHTCHFMNLQLRKIHFKGLENHIGIFRYTKCTPVFPTNAHTLTVHIIWLRTRGMTLGNGLQLD